MRTVDFTPEDLIILNIRKHIMSLLEEGNFAGVEGVIRGVMYTNRAFCKSMIVWKKNWEKSCSTLLMDVVGKPKVDPPISLIKIILDIAPEVLLVPDIANFLPIEFAIYNSERKSGRSLEVIQFLIEADRSKSSLTSRVYENAVWRNDINVLRFLLSVDNSRTILPYSNALRYTVRDYWEGNERGDCYLSEDFLKLMIESSAEAYKKGYINEIHGTLPKCCCFYDAVSICSHEDKIVDENMPRLLNLIKSDHLSCIKHLSEVHSKRSEYDW